MILKLSISNYLSFKQKETISFIANGDSNNREYYIQQQGKYCLLKMAGIFGANASGKTNIIFALKKMREIVVKGDQEKEAGINRSAFAFDDNSRNENTVFEVSFYKKIRYDYKIVFNDKMIVEETLYYYKPNRAKLFSRTVDESGESTIKFGSKIDQRIGAIKALKTYLIRNRSVLAAIGKIELGVEEIDNARNWFYYDIKIVKPNSESFRNVAFNLLENNPEIKKYVIEQLREADYNISEFDVRKKEYDSNFIREVREIDEELGERLLEQKKITFIHKVNTNGKTEYFQLDEYLESAGTLTYFIYAVILSYFTKHGGILIIDELESSLHPSLIEFFIDSFMLNTINSQLIFTSHYLPILEDQEDIRKDVVWFTNKREDGSTELYSLRDFDYRKELNFYRAYKAGKFSAKPILGSAVFSKEEDTNAK